MITITYYELLDLMKNNIAPKKVKYLDFEFYGDSYNYQWCDNNGDLHFLSDYMSMDDMLKEAIEIIEEDKEIGKLKWNEKSQHNIVTDNTKKTLEHLLSRTEQLKKCMNELIDEVNKLKTK